MRISIKPAAAAALLALSLGLAWAAPGLTQETTTDPAKACENPADAASGLAACSMLIDSGKLSGKALAAVYNQRALAHAKSGDLAKAISDFDAAIKADPAFTQAYYNRANAFDRSGKPEKALADYDTVVAQQPTLAAGFNNRCWVRAELGTELDKALADCGQALTLRAKDAKALDTRGLVYLRMGKYPEAIADYDAALEINPKLAGAWYGRGLAKLKAGDATGAQNDITAARKLDPKAGETFKRLGVTP